jgi:hypothetical protein
MSEQKNSFPSIFTGAISNVVEEKKNINPLMVNNNPSIKKKKCLVKKVAFIYEIVGLLLHRAWYLRNSAT